MKNFITFLKQNWIVPLTIVAGITSVIATADLLAILPFLLLVLALVGFHFTGKFQRVKKELSNRLVLPSSLLFIASVVVACIYDHRHTNNIVLIMHVICYSFVVLMPNIKKR